jgi:DNA-binding NarL/FixJ family response regulator
MRILLVDDFDPFRGVVTTILQEQPGLQVVGEASDGLIAVKRAEELQPDLVLLDISLPKLSGIEAARQMRSLAPQSIILFLSQNSSLLIVREAFSAGGRGYVLKLDVGNELLTAIAAVFRGDRFVSTSLAGYVFPEGADA